MGHSQTAWKGRDLEISLNVGLTWSSIYMYPSSSLKCHKCPPCETWVSKAQDIAILHWSPPVPCPGTSSPFLPPPLSPGPWHLTALWKEHLFHCFLCLCKNSFLQSRRARVLSLATGSSGQDSALSLPRPDFSFYLGTEILLQVEAT